MPGPEPSQGRWSARPGPEKRPALWPGWAHGGAPLQGAPPVLLGSGQEDVLVQERLHRLVEGFDGLGLPPAVPFAGVEVVLVGNLAGP